MKRRKEVVKAVIDDVYSAFTKRELSDIEQLEVAMFLVGSLLSYHAADKEHLDAGIAMAQHHIKDVAEFGFAHPPKTEWLQ